MKSPIVAEEVVILGTQLIMTLCSRNHGHDFHLNFFDCDYYLSSQHIDTSYLVVQLASHGAEKKHNYDEHLFAIPSGITWCRKEIANFHFEEEVAMKN